jgi:regulator of replication initiation timing
MTSQCNPKEVGEETRVRKRASQQTYRARQKQYVFSLEEKLEKLHSMTYGEVSHLMSGNVRLSETLNELRMENRQLRETIETRMQGIQTRTSRSVSAPAPPPPQAAKLLRFSDNYYHPSAANYFPRPHYERTFNETTFSAPLGSREHLSPTCPQTALNATSPSPTKLPSFSELDLFLTGQKQKPHSLFTCYS